MTLLVGVMLIGVVSALAYYAVFTASVTVTQPISIDGNLAQSVSCNAGDTCLGDAITVTNTGDEARTVKIVKNYGNEKS